MMFLIWNPGIHPILSIVTQLIDSDIRHNGHKLNRANQPHRLYLIEYCALNACPYSAFQTGTYLTTVFHVEAYQ